MRKTVFLSDQTPDKQSWLVTLGGNGCMMWKTMDFISNESAKLACRVNVTYFSKLATNEKQSNG